jgi:hypothetical protein
MKETMRTAERLTAVETEIADRLTMMRGSPRAIGSVGARAALCFAGTITATLKAMTDEERLDFLACLFLSVKNATDLERARRPSL